MGNSVSKIHQKGREQERWSDLFLAGPGLSGPEEPCGEVIGRDFFEEQLELETFHPKTATSAAVDAHLRTVLPPNLSTHPTSAQLSYPRWPSGPKLVTLSDELPEVLTARSAIERIEIAPGLDEFTYEWEHNPAWESERDAYFYWNPADCFLPSPPELAFNALSERYHAQMRAQLERQIAELQPVQVAQLVQTEAIDRGGASSMYFVCIGRDGKQTRYCIIEGAAVQVPTASATDSSCETLVMRLPGISSAPPFRALCATPHASTSQPPEDYFLLGGEEARIPVRPCGSSSSLEQLLEATSLEESKNQYPKMPIPKANLTSNFDTASEFKEYDRIYAGLAAELDNAIQDCFRLTKDTSLCDETNPRQWRPARAATPGIALRRVDAIEDLRLAASLDASSLASSPVERRAVDFERQQRSRFVCPIEVTADQAAAEVQTEPVGGVMETHAELISKREGRFKTAVKVIFKPFH